MNSDVKIFETVKVSRNPLDNIKIGDWYWVKYEKTEREPEHEHLFCIETIGSNYVAFTGGGGYQDKIHFDEFFSRCRQELKWKEYLQNKADQLQIAIKEKTRELIEAGQSLYLLPQDAPTQTDNEGSLLPVKVTDDPKKYKNKLIKLKDKTLPAISKEIDELAKDYATTLEDMSLPDMVKLNMVKKKLGVVEDKIFTIELYCGLQEEVEQIADGEPASINEKIAIRQQMLFMDEETLFDYDCGGMDFSKINDFDKWVCKPENLSRILPEKKGVVAFRVRRDSKDYGEPVGLAEAFVHIGWHDANKQTYILIRNGEKVYRIASSIDFSPRLIPRRGEIGKEQFKKIDRRWVFDENSVTKDNPFGDRNEVQTETIITPDHIEYDDHVKKLDAVLKQYNRIVILIQGLLDRSMVFHPHPPINLTKVGQLDEWINLIRDEEDGLPCNKITFEEYRDRLNSTLETGKYIYIKYPETYFDKYDPREKYYDEEEKREVILPRRGYSDKPRPNICQIIAMKRDKSSVRISWPKGQLSRPKQGKWIPNPNRPGWGHYELVWDTERMLHEWVPTKYVLNISDYTPGDYKMFLCDHALKGKYLKWAPFLMSAENWSKSQQLKK